MKIAKEVEDIIRRLEEAGYEAYAVGGGVRDALLGREPVDWDVATGASAETVTSLFPRTAQIGARFGIVKVISGDLAVDVAAYRIDGPYSDHRRPDTVIFTADLTEDLKRRDFTINAMAYSPLRGFSDPFGGRRDLEKRLIRAVGEPEQRFREDALRIIRGVRFAAQLGFTIEPETMAAMGRLVSLLDMISIERIRDEFRRILLAPYAGEGLRLCVRLGILPYILGDAFSVCSPQEQDLWEVLASGIGEAEPDWHVRMGLLLICFGKEMADSAIARLKLDNASMMKLSQAAALTGQVAGIGQKSELKYFISRYGYAAYEFSEKLIGLMETLRLGTGTKDGAAAARRDDRLAWMIEIRRDREPVLLKELAVDGKDLERVGFKPGKDVGNVLQSLLELVHRHPEYNEKDLLLSKAADQLKETDGREKGHDHGRHLL